MPAANHPEFSGVKARSPGSRRIFRECGPGARAQADELGARGLGVTDRLEAAVPAGKRVFTKRVKSIAFSAGRFGRGVRLGRELRFRTGQGQPAARDGRA